MLNHFQFKLYRHDFQIKFSRCRLMMSHLLKRYASRKYVEILKTPSCLMLLCWH